MIQPTYVTFEQAKLLKQKEFDIITDIWFDKERDLYGEGQGSTSYKFHIVGECYAPEQWQVVECLRVNHGTWIQVSISKYGLFYCNILQNQPTNKIVSCIVYNCTDTKGNFSNSLTEIHLINQSIKTI